jgi:hypothetical protein
MHKSFRLAKHDTVLTSLRANHQNLKEMETLNYNELRDYIRNER